MLHLLNAISSAHCLYLHDLNQLSSVGSRTWFLLNVDRGVLSPPSLLACMIYLMVKFGRAAQTRFPAIKSLQEGTSNSFRLKQFTPCNNKLTNQLVKKKNTFDFLSNCLLISTLQNCIYLHLISTRCEAKNVHEREVCFFHSDLFCIPVVPWNTWKSQLIM